MIRRCAGATAAAALVAGCVPAFAQQEQGLRPPPAYEREYRSFCRDRPAACAGGYGQARDDFLIKRQDDAMDDIRRREHEALQQHLQQQQRR